MSLEEIKTELEARFVSYAARNRAFGLVPGDAQKSFGSLFGKTTVIAVIIYVVAAALWAKDRLFTEWLAEVEETAAGTRYGTYEWWVKAAKDYQDGDVTSVINGTVGYDVIDESKRIVSAATVVQDGRNLTVKVAKSQGGSLAALGGEEMERFAAYMQKIKPIGIVVDVMSGSAANVYLSANVVYNAEKSASEMESELKAAVNAYLADIGFGGTIYVSRIVDAMMDVHGVIDVSLPMLGGVAVDGTIVHRSAVPASGYAVLGETDIRVRADYDKGR